MILKILTVAGLATFEIYAAIPAGFAFGLNSWTIFFAAVIGGLIGVFVSAFLGDKIRKFFRRNKPLQTEQKKDKHPKIRRVWEKYGVIGLGFIGTVMVGAPVTIAMGVTLHADIKKLVTWCCLGVLTRCVVFTLIGHYGVQLIN